MNTIIPLGPKYEDSRGVIQMLVEKTDFSSASLIGSAKDTTRATHWHKKDSHYCMVLHGSILYLERPVGSLDKPVATTIQTGELFYTPPMVEHEMFFPEDTVFLCLSTLSRAHQDYENDTTRLPKKLKDIYDGN
jgi:dTDP-4-dehydrorhamnose 3,5-epimerase-like enzyme